MKKIFKYVILLIVAYFLVNFFTNLVTKQHYRDFKNYEILTEEPKIEITECKTSYTKGYIKGNIKNTKGEMIDAVCIKVTSYNKKGEYLGTEYYPISYFYPQEEKEFELNCVYKNINSMKIEVVEKRLETDKISYLKELTGEDVIPYLEITMLLMGPTLIFTALGI